MQGRTPFAPRVALANAGLITAFPRRGRVRRAASRAKVPTGVHILRHTFCSHLAMRGAPGKAIQELAGHQELSMTQRYRHLSPAALGAAIRLLESTDRPAGGGEIVETPQVASVS